MALGYVIIDPKRGAYDLLERVKTMEGTVEAHYVHGSSYGIVLTLQGSKEEILRRFEEELHNPVQIRSKLLVKIVD